MDTHRRGCSPKFPCYNRQIFGKLEWNCILDLYGGSSLQEVEKAIHTVGNKIESTIVNLGEHLCLFRQHRRKRKVQGGKEELTVKVTSKALWKKEPQKYLMVVHTHRGSLRIDPSRKEVPGG